MARIIFILIYTVLFFTIFSCNKKEKIEFIENKINDSISNDIYGTWELSDSIYTTNNSYVVIKKNDNFIYYLYSFNGRKFLNNYPLSIKSKNMMISSSIITYKVNQDTLYLTNSNETIKYYRNNQINEKNFVKEVEITKKINLIDIGLNDYNSNLMVTKDKFYIKRYYTIYSINKQNIFDTLRIGDIFYRHYYFAAEKDKILLIEDDYNLKKIYKTNDLKKPNKPIHIINNYGNVSITYDNSNHKYYINNISEKTIYQTDTNFNDLNLSIVNNFFNTKIIHLNANKFVVFNNNSISKFDINNNTIKNIENYIFPTSDENPSYSIQDLCEWEDELWCLVSCYSRSKGYNLNKIIQIKLN